MNRRSRSEHRSAVLVAGIQRCAKETIEDSREVSDASINIRTPIGRILICHLQEIFSPLLPQYPPLLDPGWHRLTLEELHQLAVASFPDGVDRRELWESLIMIVYELREVAIPGELWVGGSFLSAKLELDPEKETVG